MRDGPKKKFWLRPWMVIVLVLAVGLVVNYWPVERTKIVPSRETTYVNGPLNSDGTVNYVEHLNREYSRGVTAENNAAPLLLRAFGIDVLSSRIRDETLRRLDLSAEEIDRDKHFVGWRDRTRPTTMADQSDNASHFGNEDDDEGPELDEVSDMVREGKIHPELDAWLAENAAPLELVRQATKKERMYLPILSASKPPEMIGTLFPPFASMRDAANALAMRARVKAIRGDISGAWEDNLTCHRLARCVPTHCLVGLMVAIGIDGLAAETGRDLATQYPMSPQQAKAVLHALSELEPLPELADTINESERLIALDAVMMMARGMDIRVLDSFSLTPDQENSGFNLDWNRMLRQINPWYDRMTKVCRVAGIRKRKQAYDAFERDLRAFVSDVKGDTVDLKLTVMSCGGRLFRGALTDKCARLILAILVPALYRGTVVWDQYNQRRDVETLAVALAGFHAEQGRWPAKLDELCPAYIPAVPTDVFTLEPLVYKPAAAGYLLYSLGENMRDDGGQWDEESSGGEREHDDIGVQVGPEAPASQPAE